MCVFWHDSDQILLSRKSSVVDRQLKQYNNVVGSSRTNDSCVFHCGYHQLTRSRLWSSRSRRKWHKMSKCSFVCCYK